MQPHCMGWEGIQLMKGCHIASSPAVGLAGIAMQHLPLPSNTVLSAAAPCYYTGSMQPPGQMCAATAPGRQAEAGSATTSSSVPRNLARKHTSPSATAGSPGSVSSHRWLTCRSPPAVRRLGQAESANWSASGPGEDGSSSSSRCQTL
jgi:hypothetical protein